MRFGMSRSAAHTWHANVILRELQTFACADKRGKPANSLNILTVGFSDDEGPRVLRLFSQARLTENDCSASCAVVFVFSHSFRNLGFTNIYLDRTT
jgi:hypothetical protein